MKINTNEWNKIRYTFYAPFYNVVERIFRKSRQRSIEQLSVKKGEKVLLIGAGTGLDLDFLRQDAEITAIDLTPPMLEKLKKRSLKLNLNVQTRVMDGQNLDFPDGHFDKIILHLIVAVIPDPVKCLQEAERVLKENGSITVFDKLLKIDKKPNLFRKAANVLANFFFSDINRKIEEIAAKTNLTIVSDLKANFNGNFRIILLKKDQS
ncbi:MAG TPA: class I SAM-dependent methyltransferase [Cytophagales bacterium]|nr:class I SAM-dependent methyltransferase [Cytophagales bacterium]